jgi:hypothetical protein
VVAVLETPPDDLLGALSGIKAKEEDFELL